MPEHLAGRDAALPAAGVGDHTEGAEFIAAALDGDEARHAVVIGVPVEPLVDLGLVEVHVHGALPRAGLVDQGRDVAVAVGPGYERDVRRGRLELIAQVLGHAARDPNDEVGFLLAVPQELGGAAVHALLRLLPDGAGVHEDHVGAVGPRHGAVPRPPQLPLDERRVGLVHLTAEGLDVHVGGVVGEWGLWRVVTLEATNLDQVGHGAGA